MALAIQVLITTVIRDGHEELHKAVHIATYVLIGVFLWSNRRLPGVKVVGLGAFLNALIVFVSTAAAIYFFVIVPYKRYQELKGVSAKTRPCPECTTAISMAARRCPACTAVVIPEGI